MNDVVINILFPNPNETLIIRQYTGGTQQAPKKDKSKKGKLPD